MMTIRRALAAVTFATIVGASAGCTVLLNHDAAQCQTDSDCAHFGDHPYCQNNVCVSSGLGPSACFYGSPAAPQDFMNQCSLAACLPFDNCSRMGLCGAAAGAGPSLVAPAVGDASASSSPVVADGGVALPSCMDPANGRAQVVFMTGSSNFPPLLAKLAPLVLATGYTPIYQVTSSCTGVSAVFGPAMIHDPVPGPSAKYAAFFAQDGTSTPCTLGADGANVDVGESDIFSTTCSPSDVAGSTVGEYLGPIQAMVFVVPGKSQEQAISEEAARAVFGTGGDDGKTTPWVDPSLYFIRNANTGTQQMVGKAIGVPPNAFWGTDRGSAANVDALMRIISDPSSAEAAIGIISADYYDSDRANLKALGFKATGQDCAYLPDLDAFKKDKENVRDGHYPIWGPLHFFVALANGVPLSPAAQAFVSIVSVPNLPKPLLDAFIGASLVPTCAMKVQRSSELGPVSQYAAPFQCGCYFEASVDGETPAGCTACMTANDCTDPTRPACNLGYCEVQ
jgi:ABC-type phosphate transport system substrate-binding protein